RLWPAQPTRPMIAQALSRGRFVDLNWIPNPERDVDRYRIYVTTDERQATDERSMTLVAGVTAADASDPSRVPNIGVTVQGAQGQPYFFRLVAVASHPAPVGVIASAPSDAVAIAPQTFVAP